MALEKLLDIKKRTGGNVLARYTGYEMKEYTATLRCLDNAGIRYLDLAPLFNRSGADIERFRENSAVQIHFNDEANRIKAEAIHQWLKTAISRPVIPVKEKAAPR